VRALALALTLLALTAAGPNDTVLPWLAQQRIERCYPHRLAGWFAATPSAPDAGATASDAVAEAGRLSLPARSTTFHAPRNDDLSGQTVVAYDPARRAAAIVFTSEGSYVSVLLGEATAPGFAVPPVDLGRIAMRGVALGTPRTVVERRFGRAPLVARCDVFLARYQARQADYRLDVFYRGDRVVGLVYVNQE
jgi:hypothetical protein